MKIFISILIFAALLGLTGLYLTTNLTGGCDDKILWEKRSPDKKLIISALERNCGATIDYITIVSIGEFGKPESFGEIFVLKGKSDVDLTWPDAKHLNVNYKGGKLFKEEPSYGEIQIEYQEIK